MKVHVGLGGRVLRGIVLGVEGLMDYDEAMSLCRASRW